MRPATDLAHTLLATDDGTFRLDTGELVLEESGYEVGGFGHELTDPSHADLVTYLNQARGIREGEFDRYRVGVWTNDEGQRVIDITRWYPDGVAVVVARDREQDAIWDWAEGAPVPVSRDPRHPLRRALSMIQGSLALDEDSMSHRDLLAVRAHLTLALEALES